MEKGKVIKSDITDKFLDDEYQVREFLNGLESAIDKLLEDGGLSSDY